MTRRYSPEALGARCSECVLKGCTVVPPEDNPGAWIGAVADFPAEEEVRQLRPLVGPSGMELNKALRMAGLNRGDLHINNTILCPVPDNDLPALLRNISQLSKKIGQHIPTPIECCKPRLDAELSRFRHLLTLGKGGTAAVTGSAQSILAIRGGLIELDSPDKGKRFLMPTISPAFVLHAPRWAHVFRNDVKKAADWFRGYVQWKPPRIRFNPTVAEFRQFVSRTDRVYSYDLETDDIECLTAKIRCLGIGNRDEVLIIGFRSKNWPKGAPGLFLDWYSEAEAAAMEVALRDFFHSEAHCKVGQNINYYDRLVLRSQMDITPVNCIDTLMLHRSIESELPHNLAYIVSMYAYAPSWKCYDGATEVLTPQGWVRFDRLQPGIPVAQWRDGAVDFVQPSAYVDQAYQGPMWVLQSQATDLCVSPDHKMIYRPIGATAYKTTEVQNLPATGYLPHVGQYAGGNANVEAAFVRLLVAFQADGTWVRRSHEEEPIALDFGFTKARKIDRLEEILCALNVPYRKTQTGNVHRRTRIWVSEHPVVAQLWGLLGDKKCFGSWLLSWTPTARHTFLAELPLWDGTKQKEHTNYNTTQEVNADWVQTCAVLSGQAARKHIYPNKNGLLPIYRVTLPGGTKRSRRWSKLDVTKRNTIPFDGRIYCVSVPSGFILVRRDGKVIVSGNTDRDGNKLALGGESDQQLHEYCAYDVSLTEEVLAPLVQHVQVRDQVDVWQSDQKIQIICADMHEVGMYVDQKKRHAEEVKLLKSRHKTLTDLRKAIGRPDFNPGSTPQLQELLFDHYRLNPDVDEDDLLTGSGAKSTGDLILRALLTDPIVPDAIRDVLKLIRRYRKLQKVLGTYVCKLRPWDVGSIEDLGWDEDEEDYEGWITKEMRKKYGEEKRGIVNPLTGRMYPGWNAGVAVTGRLSSSKPINAMNFPKALRALCCAAPGHLLVGADMDQVELRVAAARWKVQMYLRAFAEGKDPYSMTALAVFGDDFCRAAGITRDAFEREGPLVGASWNAKGKFIGSGDAENMRKLAKIIQLASQYMAQVDTVHKVVQKTEVPARDPHTGKELGDGTTDLPYARMPLRKVREMRDAWMSGAPEYARGWDMEISNFRRDGYLREPVGGRRRDFLDGENPNEIVNFNIQSATAALMNRAIIQLHDAIPLNKWGKGTGIINQCHDAIVVECPQDSAYYDDDKGCWVAPEGSIPWRVARTMEECMNQTHPTLPGVRFTAKAVVGKTWKEVG